MTRRRSPLLLLPALLAAAGFVSAQEANSAYEHLRPLEWQIGDWITEYQATSDSGPIKKGDTVNVSFSLHWSPDRSFMVNNSVAKVNGKRVATALEVISWNDEKSIVSHSYYGTWGIGQGVWTKVGDNAELEWTIQGQFGTFQGKSHVAKGADTWEWQIKNQTHDGEEMPDMPVATFQKKTGVPAEELWTAFCDAFAGKWVGTGNLSADFPHQGWSKGDKFTYHLTYTPDVDGNVLAGDGSFRVAGNDKTATARVTWYWDPDSAQVRAVACWTMGAIEEVTIYRKTAKGFLGTYATKGPDQEKFRARVRVDFSDPDTYTVKFVDGERKGETLVVWKREKPSPEELSVDDFINYHKPMLGKWKLTVEVGDEVMHGTGSWQLADNGKCFLLSAEFDGAPGLQATVGFDPVSGKCVQTSYDSEGTYQVVTIDVPGMGDGKTLGPGLIGRWEEKRFQADGTVVTAVETLKCVKFSENRRVFVWADRREQGKSLPDWKLTYERP